MKKVMALIMAGAMSIALATAVSATEAEADGAQLAPDTEGAPATGVRTVRIDENFGKWSGSGTASCRIDTAPWRFERLDRLVFNGNTTDFYYDRVADANFTIVEGRTIITLSENYLKTLTAGIHWFEAEFWVDDKGLLKEIAYNIELEIPANPVAAPVATAAPSTAAGAVNNSGGSTNVPAGGVALAIIPTFLAAGAAIASKKRK